MISTSILSSSRTLVIAGAGAALALLAAFAAIVDGAVDDGQRRWLAADLGGRKPVARVARAEAAPLPVAPVERRSSPAR